MQKFEGPQPRWRNRPTTPWDLGEGDVMGILVDSIRAENIIYIFPDGKW